MLELRPNTIERAFQLARSGTVTTLQDLASCMRREGYSDVSRQLDGPLIRKQLRDVLLANRAPQNPASG
jgi:hypothetical protein